MTIIHRDAEDLKPRLCCRCSGTCKSTNKIALISTPSQYAALRKDAEVEYREAAAIARRALSQAWRGGGDK